MTKRNGVYAGGFNGLNSTKPTQRQESDITNLGGTAPGGVTAFVGGASQWSSSKAAKEAQNPNTPPGAVNAMHMTLTDEAPDGSRNVPIHPGLRPGLFRTASDANPVSPDGEAPRSPNGKNRGESPEIVTNPKGGYVP